MNRAEKTADPKMEKSRPQEQAVDFKLGFILIGK